VLDRLGDRDGARRWVDEVLRLDPQNRAALALRQQL
jgi:hypothetical protein